MLMPSAGIALRPSFVRSIHARIARLRPFTRVQGRTPMKLPRRNLLHLAAGAAALPAVSRIAQAQSYPSRPVHWIVSFAAGGPNDIIARLVRHDPSGALRQQHVIVERA